MNNAKLEEMFETLRASCARQFGFNPRRVTAEVIYVGKEGHGKDLVHVFRDARSHSQITLKNTFATLREKQGDHPHWSESEKAHYRNSDAEIDAEILKKQADLDYAQRSPLYQDYRDQLLSHYKHSPSYRAGSSTPREAAKALISTLAKVGDPRLASFAEHLQSNDPDVLAHHLLSPCHLELETT